MKYYNAHIESRGEVVATAEFQADNFQKARDLASIWKRRQGYKGLLFMKRQKPR